MSLKRTVAQIATCTCNNWCDGAPTPHPLSSTDTPDENEMDKRCHACIFIKWVEEKNKPSKTKNDLQ